MVMKYTRNEAMAYIYKNWIPEFMMRYGITKEEATGMINIMHNRARNDRFDSMSNQHRQLNFMSHAEIEERYKIKINRPEKKESEATSYAD